jgi:VanZ like family/Concanavalin A-like lectin/glucanases superfamily
VVLGILVGGLWPFNPFPRNEVRWATSSRGLQFGDYGTVLSVGQFVSPKGTGCSVEIWLRPGLTDDSNVILAFSVPQNRLKFRIGQNGNSLTVARDVRRDGSILEQPFISISGVFQQGRDVLLTVTGGAQGTSVYLNGVLARFRPDFGLNSEDFSGAMVIANSPVGNNSWSGLLSGIALYDTELSSQDVFRHYQQWLSGENTKEAYARYLLSEGNGKLAHNSGTESAPDLYIPEHYMILSPTFLQPLWEGVFVGPAFWRDCLENVAAFIPLGFLLNAFWSGSFGKRWAFLTSVLLGVLLSCAIETLQYFLPTRDSDTIDIVTNSVGTILGACLYLLDQQYGWFGKLPGLGKIWGWITAYPHLVAASKRVPPKATN